MRTRSTPPDQGRAGRNRTFPGGRARIHPPQRTDRPVSTYDIGVIGGDGIGPEVVAEALKVVAAADVDLATTEYDLGADRYVRTGEVLPDAVLEELRGHDAILLGAVGPPVGSTAVPPGALERGLLLRLRFSLDLYVNLRPFTGVPGAPAPHCDFVVVRENTEGTYAGEGASCAGAPRSRWPPRGRSTRATASSGAPASPSAWPPTVPAIT